MYVDLPGFISPSVITGDELRPDLLLTIENKILYILELTVGFETNLKTNSDRSHEKYLTLITDQENIYDEVKFVNVSISSLGVFGESTNTLFDMLHDLKVLIQVDTGKLPVKRVRYISNSLPTRQNLARWGLSPTSDCSRCLAPETLLHVVAGCQSYPERFTCRTIHVRNFLATNLQTVSGSHLYVDLPGYKSPSVITGATYRPDLLLSTSTGTLYIVELTVGFESNLQKNVEQMLIDFGFQKQHQNYCIRRMTTIAIRTTVDDDDEVAAKTGVIGTTTIPTPYEHPSNPNIRFWDLPNIGTPNYPDLPTLCEKVAIEKYDRFLIICSTRFTENDLQLARKAQSLGKSFVFIRTMIDNDTRSEKRKLGKKFNEEKTLKKIRNDCVENLRNLNNGEGKIFLVSNYDPNKWDFDRLKKEILNPSPSKQNKSLTIPLPTRSKDILRESIKIFRDRVWMVAAASVASKFGLGPFCLFIDGKLIRKKFEFYSIQLEFPDNGSEEFQMLTEELQKKVEKFYQKPNQNRVDWLKSFDRDNTFNMRMYKKMMITKKPLVFVYRFLNLILDEMEETALAIVDEAAKRPWHADHEF
ncbi:interferon-inducible GTPase 5-like [Paramuricea clavata]|uniref:Interferon-inducible GTPase 5-like n=1 Tax=Paramuricea clavata TaxID=317549 RepID=A0A6S7JCD3_PARCT|nr:interferon-inducible GTPase 5-like [Paramuricea clavata]